MHRFTHDRRHNGNPGNKPRCLECGERSECVAPFLRGRHRDCGADIQHDPHSAEPTGTATTLSLADITGVQLNQPMCFCSNPDVSVQRLDADRMGLRHRYHPGHAASRDDHRDAKHVRHDRLREGERSPDPNSLVRGHPGLIHNPNWLQYDLDLYGLHQTYNYAGMNTYALSLAMSDPGHNYGMLEQPWEQYGYGDGSDGKAVNMNCLCVPGSANYKGMTVCAPYQRVSVPRRP